MIFDVLVNAEKYVVLHKGFAKAFAFLSRPDLQKLEPGEYAIEGDRVYAIVAKEAGRRKENAQLEAHNKYIDIQFVIAGIDTMGWRSRSSCRSAVSEYDDKDDIQFFNDPVATWVATNPGAFAIFFPEDAHLPLISSTPIHKVVVKIALD